MRMLSMSSQPRPAFTALPGSNVAFKDWSLVCDALGQGRQSLILRKGGIAEGRQGFRFKHEAFFLFPTQYHQQAERVRPEILPELQATAQRRSRKAVVSIRYFFALEWAEWLTDWARRREVGAVPRLAEKTCHRRAVCL